jgi:bacteriocin biosynthesis cyclodehydratase domain-containing protein
MASAEQVRRTAPATDVRTSRLPGAALAVVAPVTGVVPPETAAAVRRQVHLVVVVRETTAAVGPFVVPGLTPCLRCVELARSERDPQWPALAAQLAGAPRAVEACDIALATLAASLATLHALTWLDGDELPPSAGGVLEVDLEGGRLRRRSVAAHPECGCGAAG